MYSAVFCGQILTNDGGRLNVLRTVITEINNSVKTASPIQTDLQLLSWMRRRIAGAQQLTEEFAKAGRADLQQAEEAEATILEEYAGQVETMSQDDINAIVSQEISKIKDAGSKVQIGPLLKALFAPGGAMEGKPAERSEVARIAKEAVAAT